MNEYLLIGIPILTGLLGYFFREFQNKTTPFIDILYVSGNMTKGTDDVIFEDENTIEISENCIYIDSFRKEMTIEDVRIIHKQCVHFKKVHKELISLLGEILESNDSNKIIKLFSKLCSIKNFDHHITTSIAGDRISPYNNINKQEGEKIKIDFDSKENKGSYWIAFQNNTITLGHNLNTKPLRDKFSNFIDVIKFWDINGLKHYLKNFLDLIELHYQTANQLFPIADKIVDKNSRWIFKLSVTNLNNIPILILKNSFIFIYAKDFKPIEEECYLLKIEEKGEFDDAISPIIIKPGESSEIGFITKKRQVDMEKGDAVREIYNKKNSLFRIAINISKVGLFKKQIYKTKKLKFIQSENY